MSTYFFNTWSGRAAQGFAHVDDNLKVTGDIYTTSGKFNFNDTTGALTVVGSIGLTGDVAVTGNMTITGTVDGRDVSADGAKLDTVETNADVTDFTNVNAALAVANATIDINDQSMTGVGNVTLADDKVLAVAKSDAATHYFLDADNSNGDIVRHFTSSLNYGFELQQAGNYQILSNGTLIHNLTSSGIITGPSAEPAAGFGNYDGVVINSSGTIVTSRDETGAQEHMSLTNPNGLIASLQTSGNDFLVKLGSASRLFRVKNSAGTQNLFTIDDDGIITGATSFPTLTATDGKVINNLGVMASARSTTGGSSHYEFWNPNGLIGSLQTDGEDFVIGQTNAGSVITRGSSSNKVTLRSYNSNASYVGATVQLDCLRTSSSSFHLINGYSGGTADREFYISGDGNGVCDGSWTGGGADYAEYFEWADGNPDGEDRCGSSVKLVGDKIAIAEEGDDILGVISGNASVVGDGDIKWKGKYLKDDFNRALIEDYSITQWTEVTVEAVEAVDEELDKDGEVVTEGVDAVKEETKDHSYHSDRIPEGITVPGDAEIIEMVGTDGRKVLNPAFDESLEHISRENRKEWDTVGLLGKLRVKNDQVIDPGWKKMRDISEAVSEYFVK